MEDRYQIMMSVVFALLLLSCTVKARKIYDLTHTLDGNAPQYPLGFFGITDDSYTFFNTTTLVEQYFGDMWLYFRTNEFYEHISTHIDAPLHFGKGRQSLEQIPPERLIGPGVVIDVKEKAKSDPDYAVTVQDIKDHEEKYGKIPPGAIVCMNSGWAEKYPNPELVFGSDQLNDSSTFHFPGFSLDACEFLLNMRQVSVVGVDTTSTDPSQAGGLFCHTYLQPNNVPLLEYVANLDSIPVRGTTMVLGAMKIRDGTGGPTRIFAIMEEEEDREANSANMSINNFLYGICVVIISFIFNLSTK